LACYGLDQRCLVPAHVASYVKAGRRLRLRVNVLSLH
jgi:hypothetical protein